MDFLDERMSLPIQGVSIDWDPIDYEDTDSYQITKMFIENKEQFLKRLLSDEDKADF